jgi:hypothetical protein
MTKKKASNCADCKNFLVDCSLGHKPYFFKGIGYRKICSDFAPYQPSTTVTFLQRVRNIFGI